MNSISKKLAAELSMREEHVENVIKLLDEGATIPFIARYRKEAHGSADDTTLRKLEERLKYLRNLAERKDEIAKAIDNQGKLTEALTKTIENANTLAELEDIYRPYKQKRKTRASIAREKGLAPLAELILSQLSRQTPEEMAKAYLDPEKEVNTVEDALKGASDILAEEISDSAAVRKALREFYMRNAEIRSEKKKDEDSVYATYYEFAAKLGKIQGHQVLALNRGEKEGFLTVSLYADKEQALALLAGRIVKGQNPGAAFLREAIEDSYTRLLFPSMQNEIRASLTEAAADGAIHNFALNLKPLLMQPPVKGSVTMGLDPGYRMGCKVAVVDPTGKVLDTTVVYPTYGEKQKNEAIAKLTQLIKKHSVKHIAIGNGTASRETEIMTAELIGKNPGVSYMVVSEAGASVYSASPLGAEEFPQYDVNVRSAISIARRLQDPLAELVKIEPKAIGVGQYQHDMPQKKLEESLDAVVEDCVNAVGVDLNTASPSLLRRVSGITPALAKNIVAYREEKGRFTARRELLKVSKLGPKAYEQCAGFLRIAGGKEMLDNTGVHPESYEAARALLERSKGNLSAFASFKNAEEERKVAEACGIGVPTMRDILKELSKPGRDPRDELPAPIFRKDLLSISDLKPGMILDGTVRNVIDFGVFVDIGVHQDGLVHISEIGDKFIKHPSEALSVGDNVKVLVLGVDEKKKRISLSIKKAAKQPR